MTWSFGDWEAAIWAEVEVYCRGNDDLACVLANDDSLTDYLPRQGAHGTGLIWSGGNGYRSELATWLYYRHRIGLCAQSIYREALNAAWSHDHDAVIAYARNNHRLLRAMFRHAGFPVPAELPDRMDIWRGSGGEAPDLYGPSWITNRDVACWFACNCGDHRFRGNRPPLSPLVFKLTVPKAELAFLFDDRNGSEVVYLATPGPAIVDGNPPDWIAAARRRSSREPILADHARGCI